MGVEHPAIRPVGLTKHVGRVVALEAATSGVAVTCLGLALATAGLVAFRRRDVTGT